MVKLLPTFGAPSRWPESVWAAVPPLLAAGRAIQAIAAMEGMPSYHAIRDRIRKRSLYERAFKNGAAARRRAKKKVDAAAGRPARKRANVRRSRYRMRAGLVPVNENRDGRYQGVWRFSDAMVAAVLRKLKSDLPVSMFGGKDGLPSAAAIGMRYQYDPVFAAKADQVAPGKFRRASRRKYVAPYSEEVWDRVAELLNAGTKLADIEKLPAMPPASSISHRRRRYPEFAARVPPPAHRWSPHVRKEVWDAVLSHLRQGRTIEAVSRLPGMPTANKIRGKVQTDKAFGQFVDQIILSTRASPEERRNKHLERCRAWRQRAGTNATRQPGLHAKFFTAENIKSVRASRGWSQTEMGDALGTTQHQVSRWETGGAAKPETADWVGARLAEMMGLSAKVKRTGANEVYAAAEAAVSRRLAESARVEIIANIVMAVYDGSLAVADIAKKSGDFVAAYKREFEGMDRSLEDQAGPDGYTLGNKLGLY